MGDPALAEASQVYDLPQFHDPRWSAVEGDALRIDCHYLSLADNLCDPAHVSFVHLSTLGNAEGEDVPVHNEKLASNKLVTWRWIIEFACDPAVSEFGKFAGNVDRWHYYHYTAPSIAVIDFGSALTGTGAPEGARDKCIQIYACHFITPVDADSCIDHWLFVKNFATDAATSQAMVEQFRIAFNEDKTILEAIHRKEKEPRAWHPLRLAIDAAAHAHAANGGKHDRGRAPRCKRRQRRAEARHCELLQVGVRRATVRSGFGKMVTKSGDASSAGAGSRA